MDNFSLLTASPTPPMMSDDDNNTQGDKMDDLERNFYMANGVIGTVLNTVVLLIALRHADTLDKPRQIIVINMTLADLLVCMCYMLTRPYVSQFPRALCYPYYVSIFTPQLCSCLNLLWINADKFIFIKRPLHYYTLVRRGRVLALMAASWSCLLALALALYATMKVEHPCDIVHLSMRIYTLICVLYVLTISASFGVSAVIYCIAHNSRRVESKEARSRLFKRLFFVFSSTLWTFATCLPYRLLYLANLARDGPPPPLIRFFIDIFYRVLVIGIVINPLITIITQRLYRQWICVYACRLLAPFGLRRRGGTRESANVTLVSTDRRRSELTREQFGRNSVVAKMNSEDGGKLCAEMDYSPPKKSNGGAIFQRAHELTAVEEEEDGAEWEQQQSSL